MPSNKPVSRDPSSLGQNKYEYTLTRSVEEFKIDTAREADRHLFGNGDSARDHPNNSLSPSILEAEFEENKAHANEDQALNDAEKSHLYETGD